MKKVVAGVIGFAVILMNGVVLYAAKNLGITEAKLMKLLKPNS